MNRSRRGKRGRKGRVDRRRPRPGPRKRRRSEPSPPPAIGEAAIEAGAAIGDAAIEAGGAIGGAVVQGSTAVGGAVVQGTLKLGSAVVRRSTALGVSFARRGARRAHLIARRMLGRTLRARARLAVPASALLLLVALFACVRETGTHRPATPPRATAREEEPRVRIAVVEAAAEVPLVLSGPWQVRVDPPLRPARGERTVEGSFVARAVEGGLELAGAERLSFPGASGLRFSEGVGQASTFQLGSRTYRGELALRRLESGQLQAIVHVGIEEYLTQVIGHEMPLRWSDAAVEAQAIAARTYALATRKPDAAYDLFADERSQVFRGIVDLDQRARTIVERTRGRVVTWQGNLVTTYFHSTCGGDTVPAPWVFSWELEEKAPLTGARDCPCQASKFYRWTETRDLATQVKELVLELPLRELVVEHHPRGMYVKSLRVVDAGGDVELLDGTSARRAFGLRSPAWDVELSADGRSATFEGRGWGHGVGMCQFGAEGQAKRGLDAIRIIEHYYPGARVESRGW